LPYDLDGHRPALKPRGGQKFPLRPAHSPRGKFLPAARCSACAAPFLVLASRLAALTVRRRRGQGVPGDISQGTKRRPPMANALGYVSETKTGFEGSLAMMNLSATIRIETNVDKTEEGQPDYRIYAGETSTEIGGGWMRKAKASGRDYVSLTLADPQIGPRRIFANLAPVKGRKGRHVILWNPRD
tara:strand:+ start:2610 stop:3167 length:558 start_codon:yes stop_codon:yes gene_type:complete